jgi:hypothetical protein
MSEIRLPLWFISERQRLILSQTSPVAFTETEKATAFLCSRSSGECRIQLVADAESLLGLVADLHELGVDHIHMDVAPDGSGGIRVPIALLASVAARSAASVS